MKNSANSCAIKAPENVCVIYRCACLDLIPDLFFAHILLPVFAESLFKCFYSILPINIFFTRGAQGGVVFAPSFYFHKHTIVYV